MANTYTLISSNVLTGSAASVTFSSILNTYTDLVLRCSIRNSSTSTLFTFTFTGAAGNAYSETALRTNGSTASSSITNANSQGNNRTTATNSNSTANTFGSYEMYIPNYTSSANKPISTIFANENNTATLSYIEIAEAQLISYTSAINEITLSSGNQFVAGSSFYLYGIKNS